MAFWNSVRSMYNKFTGGRQVVFLSRSISQGYFRSKATDPWLDIYSQMPWARAVTNAIGGGVASLEWGLTRTYENQTIVTRGGLDVETRKRTTWNRRVQRMGFAARQKALATMEDEGQSEPIFEHPFLDFWKNPCPMLPGNLFHYLCQVYYEIAGETFILVDRGPRDEVFKRINPYARLYKTPMEIEVFPGLPSSAYPIPPNWVRRLPTPEQPTFEVQGPAGVLFSDVPMSSVWWLKNPDPVQPYLRGSGMMMTLGDEFNADENAARMMNHRFYNRGSPEALVALEGATATEVQAFANDWLAKNQGAQNAFRVHFANWKAQVEKMGDDFRELQLLELRKYMRDMIRQVPGIPPEILGIVDNSNRATIDAAEHIFNKRVVIPRAEMWRTFLQERVVPLYDPRAIVDYVSPLVEDKEYALRVAATKPSVIRVKEWRRMADLPPLPADEGELFIKDDGTAVRSLAELVGAAPAAGAQPGLPGMGAPPGMGGSIHVPGSSNPTIDVPAGGNGGLPAGGGMAALPAPGQTGQPQPAAPQAKPPFEVEVKGASPFRVVVPYMRKDWDESLHPRNEAGEFTSGGGGGEGGGEREPKDVVEAVHKVAGDDAAIIGTRITPPSTGKPYDPDVRGDSDGDGVYDAARVGVPADEVPPPPKDIPRLPNLSEDERRAEDTFAKAYEADPDKYADAYRQMELKKAEEKGEPPSFGTDDAKMLDGTWNKPGASEDEKIMARQMYNTALHGTANAIAKRAFVQHLDSLKPGDRVLVTVGGCGAGKGFALKSVPDAKSLKGLSKAVWDSAGDQNATENPWVLKECEKRGLKATFVMVHNDPMLAFAGPPDHPDRGVIFRANTEGRMVDAAVFADSYVLGYENHRSFYEKNKGKADFLFLDNRGKSVQIPGMPEMKYTRKQIYDFARETVRKNRSKLRPSLVRGTFAGSRVWSGVFK